MRWSYVFVELGNGDTVEAFGFRIGGEVVGTVSCQCSKMDNLERLSTARNEVIDDNGGPFLFIPPVDFLQDLSGTTVNAGAPGSGELIVEVADEQGVPKLVVDTSAGTFFGDNTGLDGLFEQVKDGVFAGIGVDACLHLLDDVEGEGAAEYSSVAKEPLTGRGQAAHAQFKNGGDGVGQGKLSIEYVAAAGLIGRYRSGAVCV